MFRLDYCRAIQEANYNEAAALFHYEDTLSGIQIKSVRNRLSYAIKMLTLEYGKIEHSKDVPSENKYHITISAMDTIGLKNVSFWKKVVFPVNFEQSGLGFLDMEFFKESWNSISIKKITYEVHCLNDDFRDKMTNLGAIIKVLVTQKEKLQNRFGTFYYRALEILKLFNPLAENQDELKSYEDLWLPDILEKIEQVESLADFQENVYLILSFNNDEYFRSIRKTTDKMSDEIWHEWKNYNM